MKMMLHVFRSFDFGCHFDLMFLLRFCNATHRHTHTDTIGKVQCQGSKRSRQMLIISHHGVVTWIIQVVLFGYAGDP
jgi:hypothetical protein